MSNAKQGCAQRVVTVSYADLPLSCPTGKQRVWDAHPRVYLPIRELGEVVCPYCGTKYILKDFRRPGQAAPADTEGY